MQAYEIIDFPYRDDAEVLFERVRSLPDAIWLDSGKPHSLYGRFDIISAAPDVILETRQGSTEITTSTTIETSRDNPFHLIQQYIDDLGNAGEELTGHPFTGGIAGFWGYDLGHSLNHLDYPETLIDGSLPDMRVGRYLWSLVLNHDSRQAHLFFHPLCPAELMVDIKERLYAKNPAQTDAEFSLTSTFSPSMEKQDYLQKLVDILDYIQQGDCYQVNFAQHFSAQFKGDPWTAYQVLRKALPSPYSAYLAWDDKAILSLSPERFLKHSMGQVEAKPIKGTMPRGDSLEEDQALASQLQNSLKDRSENLMIVDLLRNDLSKSCQQGSIKVPRLFQLESYKNVHHLVSTVTGTLNTDRTALNLLEDAFPGGSITGAPKRRAMEIITQLESHQRTVYCGSIGYLSVSGRMDTNIAIRTVVAEENTLNCWGGGGIVADSTPEQEYGESINKIQILMETLQQNFNL